MAILVMIFISLCEKQYDLDLKQNVTKKLIEYIDNNSIDYDDHNFYLLW